MSLDIHAHLPAATDALAAETQPGNSFLETALLGLATTIAIVLTSMIWVLLALA